VLLPLTLVPSVPVVAVLLFCGAFLWAPYTAVEISTIQRLVPAHQHGAVLGARRAVLVLASPAGAAVGGLLLEKLSAPTVIALSGVACLVVGCMCLINPAIRRIEPPPS
jgi:predicted MFS family arabinose efflux permease